MVMLVLEMGGGEGVLSWSFFLASRCCSNYVFWVHSLKSSIG